MKLFHYIASIFDESAPSSFSRWATAFTVLTGCWAVIHLVRLNHALPGPADLAALAFWMTSPYGINKIAKAWDNKGEQKPEGGHEGEDPTLLPPGAIYHHEGERVGS